MASDAPADAPAPSDAADRAEIGKNITQECKGKEGTEAETCMDEVMKRIVFEKVIQTAMAECGSKTGDELSQCTGALGYK